MELASPASQRLYLMMSMLRIMTFGAAGFVLAACSTYSTAIDEFDSIAGWDDPAVEPAAVKYPDTASQYPWYAWFMPSDPSEGSVDSPSSFARERIQVLGDYVTDDLTSMAQVVRRSLWVAHADPNPYNRISALQIVEQVLQALEVDILDEGYYLRDVDAQEQKSKEAVFLAADASLRELFAQSTGGSMSASDQAAYLEALQVYTAEPLPRMRWQRDLIRTTWSIYTAGSDPVVRDAAAAALRKAIGFAACNGLRSALVPQESGTLSQPAVRLAVVSTYRRLGGVRAVSFLLNTMKGTSGVAGIGSYDQDLHVRRLLVRLCGQLNFEHADAGSFGGQRPIEFLYSVGVDETEDDGLRTVALECLARCLSGKIEMKTVPVGDEWAKAWWKRDVVERNR